MGKDNQGKDVVIKKRKKDEPENDTGLPIKAQTSIPAQGDNFYKDTIEREENEALQRDPDSDLDLFCSTCEKFRILVREIAELKASNSPQAAAQIADKRKQACLLFMVLKKLNRLEKYRTNDSREKLHKVKQQTDSCHLQLQNLLYEILHLQKEVTKCLQFKSKDEDIDLVPVEEFLAEAPEAISRQDMTANDPHQLRLARLEWELKQRRQLAALCQESLTEKEKVASEINKKQSQLHNLAPMLKEVLNVAQPVQEALGLTTGPSYAQQKVAEFLPHPLYFLFVQADALREAGDQFLSVRIEGEQEDAVRFKRSVTEVDTASIEDSDSDNQEENSSKRHGHRKKSRTERLEDRRKMLLQTHPLTVVLDINLRDELGSIRLEFSYLTKLHLVTVKPIVKLSSKFQTSITSPSVSRLLDSCNILTELFPEDFGEESPNVANAYQLKQVSLESLDTSVLGLAYVWVQRIAGLNFSSASGSERDVPVNRLVSQTSIPGVIKAIKKRVQSRVYLCAQLQALGEGRIPELPEVVSCFPQKLLSQLTQWQGLGWAEFSALDFTRRMIQQGCVTERDILYKAVLVRNNASLTMAVAIKNSYPQVAPVFVLQAAYENAAIEASNNDSIRDLEREVNVYFDELLEKIKPVDNLLTAQILRLMTCFDILLEASTNQDFPRDKIFIQPNRGRNRARPFKQSVVGGGVFHFSHR